MRSNMTGQAMMTAFRTIFESSDDSMNQRSKFLSRLFGIFSEKIVHIWAGDPRAPYEDLGRPTVRAPSQSRGYTLDFTFRERASGKILAAEMKCEIEYLGFRYFILQTASQVDRHKKPAFEAFLAAARSPDQVDVTIGGRKTLIDGAILVWGAMAPGARELVMAERGFHDILSVEDICRDLAAWRNPEYREMIERYRSWSNRLFDGLLDP